MGLKGLSTSKIDLLAAVALTIASSSAFRRINSRSTSGVPKEGFKSKSGRQDGEGGRGFSSLDSLWRLTGVF